MPFGSIIMLKICKFSSLTKIIKHNTPKIYRKSTLITFLTKINHISTKAIIKRTPSKE